MKLSLLLEKKQELINKIYELNSLGIRASGHTYWLAEVQELIDRAKYKQAMKTLR